MSTINSNQPSVSFGSIKFANKSNWIKNGQTLLKEFVGNEHLAAFARKNPDKDIVFFSRVKKGDPKILDFRYKVRDRSVLGLIKGMFSKGVSLAEVHVGRYNDSVRLKDAHNLTAERLAAFGKPMHPQLLAEQNQIVKEILTEDVGRFRSQQTDAANLIKGLSSIK